MADSGAYSVSQLRSFKETPNPMEFIRTKFPWMPENCIIRLGGCYSPGWCRVSISGEPMLEIGRNDAGLMAISFVLKKDDGETIATMDENVFHANPAAVHDLAISASANRIKIWAKKHRIGLQFHYSRRSPTELEKYIQRDTPVMPDSVGQPASIENLEELYTRLSQIKEYMPEIAAMGYRRKDHAGTLIRWHTARHIGTDGKIPLLDFVSCRLFHAGKSIELRNGRLANLRFCAANTFSF